MINILRPGVSPSSLVTAEIQSYITELADHLADPTLVKPEKPGSYRNSDLLDAFDTVFHSKCYLTEEKFINSYVMDIEHFVSQTVNPLLRYQWNNLYPAGHQANMNKPRITPNGGWLDPCDPADDVETEIIYSVSSFGKIPGFDPLDTNNIKAVNTCNLLERLHNGTDEYSSKTSQSLRHAIETRYQEILHLIAEYGLTTDQNKLSQLKREIKGLLSRKASFTMLMRSMPAVKNLSQDFFD